MGNAMAIGGKKKKIKVMKIDGSTFKLKPPATAGEVLRDHPGHSLLDSDEVKEFSIRARPLDSDRDLKPGRLYFLVELPKKPLENHHGPVPRRAWSGALQLGARERLETMMLSRRAVSDLSAVSKSVENEGGSPGTPLRLKVRLPKEEVAKLVEQSRDSAEAAQKIMQLCATVNGGKKAAAAGEIVSASTSSSPSPPPRTAVRRKEKRTRFVPLPDEIIV